MRGTAIRVSRPKPAIRGRGPLAHSLLQTDNFADNSPRTS
jgi:hypothetical protein